MLTFVVLIAILFILMSMSKSSKKEKKSQVASLGQLRSCPFCAEDVKIEAKICKHCKSELPEYVAEPVIIDMPYGDLPYKHGGKQNHCEKCGEHTPINYGDAYHRICDSCS